MRNFVLRQVLRIELLYGHRKAVAYATDYLIKKLGG